MSTETPREPSDRERLERLERTVRWLKLGVAILLVALVLLLIPPIFAVLGFLLYVAVVGGGMIALITGIVMLLERYFPGDTPNSRRP